jgi:hypothetical protein
VRFAGVGTGRLCFHEIKNVSLVINRHNFEAIHSYVCCEFYEGMPHNLAMK